MAIVDPPDIGEVERVILSIGHTTEPGFSTSMEMYFDPTGGLTRAEFLDKFQEIVDKLSEVPDLNVDVTLRYNSFGTITPTP